MIMQIRTGIPAILSMVFALVHFSLLATADYGQTTPQSQLKSCLQEANIKTWQIIFRDGGESKLTRANYSQLTYQYNQCCGQKTPMAILLVETVSDIRGAILCCKKLGIWAVAKGGGHSYGKFSYGDSNALVIDLRNLDTITVDQSTKTATIGPGALIGPTIWKLYNSGRLMFPYGVCVTIGMGYVLGGGQSEFSRLYGMASDNLLEIEMINAAGERVTASCTKNPDLFWALRGAGGGSFGIVTKFKFRLRDAPVRVVRGIMKFELDEFVAVFSAWQAFIKSSPPNTIYGRINIRSSAIELKIVEYHRTEEQASAADGIKKVRAILETIFPPSFISKIQKRATFDTISFLEWILASSNESHGYQILTQESDLAHITRTSLTMEHSLFRAKKGFYAPTAGVNSSDITALQVMLQERPSRVYITLRSLGGAVNELGDSETAFVHRKNALYEFDVVYSGPLAEAAAGKSWLKQFFEKARSILNHTETLQNHLDPDEPDWLNRHYGANVKRLIEVKTKYDPDNFFHHPQSIPLSLAGGQQRSFEAKLC